MKNLSIFEPQMKKHHAYKKNMYYRDVERLEKGNKILLGEGEGQDEKLFKFQIISLNPPDVKFQDNLTYLPYFY